MSHVEGSHIEALIDARETLIRQIDLIKSSRAFLATNTRSQIHPLIMKLKATLGEIEECIATETKMDDADRA